MLEFSAGSVSAFYLLSPSARRAVLQALSVRLAVRSQKRSGQGPESLSAGGEDFGVYCSLSLISTRKSRARRCPSHMKNAGSRATCDKARGALFTQLLGARGGVCAQQPSMSEIPRLAAPPPDSHFPPGKHPLQPVARSSRKVAKDQASHNSVCPGFASKRACISSSRG